MKTVEDSYQHSRFPELPFEVWASILEIISHNFEESQADKRLTRKILNSEVNDNDVPYGWPSCDPCPDITFGGKCKTYAQLRLVCKTWYHILTPILYETVAIRTGSSTDLDEVAEVFEGGANYIRTAIFSGGQVWSNWVTSKRVAAETVGRGLGRCARVTHLTLNGNVAAFTNRAWLSRHAPSLASTVTSLTMYNPNGMDVSYALLGLGTMLQSLEILCWDDTKGLPLSSFHMPHELPNLWRVVFNSDNQHRYSARFPVRIVKRLLRRVSRSRGGNPLRSLHLLNTIISVDDVIEILSVNKLGVALTSLKLSMIGHNTLPHESDIHVLTVVRLCPNLVDLGLENGSEDILDSLPRSLQRFCLAFFVTPNSVARFLESRRCPALQTLIMDSYDNTAFLGEAFQITCENLDISFQFKHPPSASSFNTWLQSVTLTLPAPIYTEIDRRVLRA